MYQFIDVIGVHATLPGKSQKSTINDDTFSQYVFLLYESILCISSNDAATPKKSSIGFDCIKKNASKCANI